MGKIIPFTGITVLDLDPDEVLEKTKGKLEGLVLSGFDADGNIYMASTYSDGGTILWLLEQCKNRIINGD